jgi:hypothetical protein
MLLKPNSSQLEPTTGLIQLIRIYGAKNWTSLLTVKLTALESNTTGGAPKNYLRNG